MNHRTSLRLVLLGAVPLCALFAACARQAGDSQAANFDEGQSSAETPEGSAQEAPWIEVGSHVAECLGMSDAVEKARCATDPTRRKGTLLKRANAQSSTLAPEDVCFLPVGRHALAQERVLERGTTTTSFKIDLAAPLEACEFQSGFVAVEHLVGGSDVWMRPVPKSDPITSDFGPRPPCGACSNPHQGIDYGSYSGSNVIAARSGQVLNAGTFGSAGVLVAIHHGPVAGRPLTSRYMHNSRVLTQVGARVAARQVISKSGSTGFSSGPHLHFDIMAKEGFAGGADVNPHSLSPVFL